MMAAIAVRGAEAPAALEVVDLAKRYSDTVTVGPLSFSVRPGEFFSLLGPSGCGKSTTLRCIAGFETPTAGAIWLNGDRLDRRPAHKRALGIVFQSSALFPHLTVADNVGFGLSVRRMPRAEARPRVERALDLVGLGGLGGRMPSQLSGGQQQRVALARCLVLEPPLLLLDEPLSSLDLKLRQQMRDELRALQRQLAVTTIFVTHDQTEALAMSDRIAVLADGRIEQVGSPVEVYREPATRFVADFIGNSNILEVEADGSGPGDVMLALRNGLRLAARRRAAPARTAWAVIRPEHLRPSRSPHAEPGTSVIAGDISAVEFLGEDTQLRVEVAGIAPLLVAVKSTRDAAELAGTRQVYLHVRADDVYLLPR